MPHEVRLSAYDSLVDALWKTPKLGKAANGTASRAAVFRLGAKVLGWRIAERLRTTRHRDGTARSHPRSAASLDELREFDHGSVSSYDTVPGAEDVAVTVERRDQTTRFFKTLKGLDGETASIIMHYAVGFGPEDIARRLGMSPNAIAARKSRFVRKHRDDFS